MEAQAKRESDLTSGLVTTEGLETNFPITIGTMETPTESPVIDQQLETNFPILAPVNNSPLETNFPITQAPETPKRIKRKGGGTYPDQRPTGTKPTTSAADRQLAGVINLLMKHAHQWDEQHWEAFLDVVQSLRGSQAATSAPE